MTDLVRYTPPGQDEWGQLVQLSEMIAPAPFVPDALRGKPGAVMGAMLMGRELGIGPMQSLNDIAFIKGRRTLAATLMVSLVRGRGHKFRTVESTATRAVVQIHRKGEPEPEPAVEFTWEDAQTAGLTGGDNYKKYPKAMLWSRAASAACRQNASECLGGNAYTPEEIASIDEDPGSTTATWGEPEQDTGPQGTPEGARGRRVTADPADPVHPSGSVEGGLGAAPPGPDQTPDGLGPPGPAGGQQAPAQRADTPAAPGAAANLKAFGEACKALGIENTAGAKRLREGGWTLPQAWWKTIERWSHDDLAEAIEYLEQGSEPPEQAEVKAS